MTYQSLVKTKLTWEEKVALFATRYGPFTTRWDDYRSFADCEGFYEVYWPALGNQRPPLIEHDEKPRCAACGSRRPMFLRYLTDRQGLKHLVGQECCRRLIETKHLTYIDFDSPIPKPESED